MEAIWLRIGSDIQGSSGWFLCSCLFFVISDDGVFLEPHGVSSAHVWHWARRDSFGCWTVESGAERETSLHLERLFVGFALLRRTPSRFEFLV